jgi:hypothetical protein
VFGPGGGKGAAQPAVDAKSLHAKIGELTLENDFLESRSNFAGRRDSASVLPKSQPSSSGLTSMSLSPTACHHISNPDRPPARGGPTQHRHRREPGAAGRNVTGL